MRGVWNECQLKRSGAPPRRCRSHCGGAVCGCTDSTQCAGHSLATSTAAVGGADCRTVHSTQALWIAQYIRYQHRLLLMCAGAAPGIVECTVHCGVSCAGVHGTHYTGIVERTVHSTSLPAPLKLFMVSSVRLTLLISRRNAVTTRARC